ncbi:MAG: hypothetical protein QOG58_1660, partial [Caballeronia sp.]|nr:hypothetical protein [Caballeronia sp.]
GYTDHSAFTRQFKATVGLTPTEYRALLRTHHVVTHPAAHAAAKLSS